MNSDRRSPHGSKLAPLAPATPNTDSSGRAGNGASAPRLMPYSCQTCALRKVKCNKEIPTCSSCRKSKLDCRYQAPPPRTRKKQVIGGLQERLARYERILRENGLLDAESDNAPENAEVPQEGSVSLRWEDSTAATPGPLVTGLGKSRSVESYSWRDLTKEEEDGEESDEDQEVETTPHETVAGSSPGLGSLWDPLTGALLETQRSLVHQHPAPATALVLWKSYLENVEPLLKMIHAPSFENMLQRTSQDWCQVSRADDCLLFAVYHFAVFSMTEDELSSQLGPGLLREDLLRKYHSATLQALTNASFLKTTNIKVLQALILFLVPCSHSYHPATYWILTGIAVRIAQRMSLFKNEETLGLTPFEAQMRRRLLYQLLPLDGQAGSTAGVDPMPISSIVQDMKQPLNINDGDMWPGMRETPVEQNKGSTEMIFCLVRSTLGRFVTGLAKPGKFTGNLQFKDYKEADGGIEEAENEVEEKYLRYCDVINPLHFLAVAFARSAIAGMRLRARLPKVKNNTATQGESKDMMGLAAKILDADVAIYAHPGMQRFWWRMRNFFLWGTWDSLILILTTLCKGDGQLARQEVDDSWSRLGKMYRNHGELLEVKRTRNIAIARLVLRAWDAQPASPDFGNSDPSQIEPEFIASLRSLLEKRRQWREAKQQRSRGASTASPDAVGGAFANSHFAMSQAVTGDGTPSDLWAFDVNMIDDMDFDIGGKDWVFWDQVAQQG